RAETWRRWCWLARCAGTWNIASWCTATRRSCSSDLKRLRVARARDRAVECGGAITDQQLPHQIDDGNRGSAHARPIELLSHFGARCIAVVDVFLHHTHPALLQVVFCCVTWLAPIGAI